MKKILLFAWLLIPAAAGAYHFGPGQDALRADRAAERTEVATNAARAARELAAKEGEDAARPLWAEAVDAYGEAIELLPSDRVRELRALRLERAKAEMFVSRLPEARRDLGALVEELSGDESAGGTGAGLLDEARGALANAQYYTTWLLRLEGAAREEWEPEVDASRQNYKLLAEKAATRGDAAAAAEARENLESAIRLSRMDLAELQGLPLPSQ